MLGVVHRAPVEPARRGLVDRRRSRAKLVPLLARGDLAGAGEAIRAPPRAARRGASSATCSTPRRGAPLADLERVADERQFEEVQGAGAYLWVLGTIGSSAPFIGLFGTVIGIIRAFHSMALAGTGGFGVVAGGISEALIATALGLADRHRRRSSSTTTCRTAWSASTRALRIGSARVLEAVAAGAEGRMALGKAHTARPHRRRDQRHAADRRLPRPAHHLHDHDLGDDEARGRRRPAEGGAETRQETQGRHGHDDAVARDLRERAAGRRRRRVARERAARRARASSQDKVVILAGDRQVVLGEVVRVLGLAKEAGATGFALASE